MTEPAFGLIADPRSTIRRWVVAPEKISAYLLNLSSKDGAAKAARLLRHNFTFGVLQEALTDHGRHGRFDRARDASPWGVKFEIVEPLPTPLNTYLQVRTVWIIRPVEPSLAEFVTATFED